MARPETLGVHLDLSLLRGLEFRCRPDCGLCCFARPFVTPSERLRLLQIAPETAFVPGTDSGAYIPSRPKGGACVFLREKRCNVHSARPFPCREFPLSVYLGERIQATAIFSCPGVSFEALAAWSPGKRIGEGPSGFDEEITAARTELRTPTTQIRLRAARADVARVQGILQRQGRWVPVEEARNRIRLRIRALFAAGFPVSIGTASESDLEACPLYFDEELGVVALVSTAKDWLPVALREGGGIQRRMGAFPLRRNPPRLDAAADTLAQSYLSYMLQRDIFVAAVIRSMNRSRGVDVECALTKSLTALGADVVSRAWLRAQIRDPSTSILTERDVRDGICATDMDALDRPVVGAVL